MRYYLTLLLLVFLSTLDAQNLTISHGSSILTVISPDTIWMAADSKLTLSSDPNGKYTIEKIHEVKNVFYAFAELAFISEGKDTLFDAGKVLAKKINDGLDFYKIGTSINDSILSRLNEIINENNSNKIILQQKYLDKPVLEFIMLSFKEGRPLCYTTTFALRRGVSDSLEVHIVNQFYYEKGIEIFFVGEHDAMKKFLTKESYYLKTNIQEKVVCLVKLEAENNKYVGLPITAVTIYSGGAKWRKNLIKCDF